MHVRRVCGCPCRILYDPDFNDNESATLASLNLVNGSLLRLDDDTQEIKLQLRLIDRCAPRCRTRCLRMALRLERPRHPLVLPHSVDFADANALFELNRAEAEAAAAAAAAAAATPVAGQKRKADDDAIAPALSGPVTVDDEDDLIILDAAPDTTTTKRARTE